jgi:tetratricopeptide (TPR) repeat protein
MTIKVRKLLQVATIILDSDLEFQKILRARIWVGRYSKLSILLIALVFWCQPLTAATGINLLRVDGVQMERTSVRGEGKDRLVAIVDGNSETSMALKISQEIPLDIVYAYGGDTVSPEKLVIELVKEEGASKGVAGTVEILVSTLSANAGYQSLRVNSIKMGKSVQSFSFPPTAAKWIMIRFKSISKDSTLNTSEIKVLGYEGPPVSRYAFNESPAGAVEVIVGLKGLSAVHVQTSEEEQKLFEDAQDGRLDEKSFAEAAFFASGVLDDQRRKRYVSLVDSLEVQAREAVIGGKTSFEKGELLLKWLHKNQMSQGYHSAQTDVSVILDDKTFNCVSSATLYNILGIRLGLDLRAIEVPDHAFSIMYDGTEHADVETTNPSGFNPSRDPAILKEINETTGFSYIPYSHQDKRREIRQTGLVAITYYNHGVMLSKDKKYHEALLAYFKALSLDSQFASAVRNILSALANWGIDLSDNKQFDEALTVVRTGLQLAPEDAALLNNRKAIWYAWAESAIDSGNSEQALQIFARAAEDVPSENFLNMQSWVFINPGEKLVKSEEWNNALALANSGFEQLNHNKEAQGELREWKSGLFLRWSNSKIEKGEFAEAAGILDQGIRDNPDEKRFTNNLGYITQEWSKAVYTSNGAQEAEKVLSMLIDKYPDVPGVRDAAIRYVHLLVERLKASADFGEKTFSTIERCNVLVKDQKKIRNLKRMVYDTMAGKLIDKEDWQGAVDVYSNALKAYPGDSHLQNNAVTTWGRWAQTYIKDSKWDTAMDVYAKALILKLDNKLFKGNIGYVAQEWSKAVKEKEGTEQAEAVLLRLLARFPEIPQVKTSAKGYAYGLIDSLKSSKEYEKDALSAVERCRKLIGDEDEVGKLIGNIYYNIAESYTQKNDWASAVEVYVKAVECFPNDQRIRNNAMTTWGLWIQSHYESVNWSQSFEVCNRAIQEAPDPARFRKKLGYIAQEWSKAVKEKEGTEQAEAVLLKISRRYPEESSVKSVAQNYVFALIDNMELKDEYYVKGQAVIERCKDIIGDAEQTQNLISNLCYKAAQYYMDQNEWESATDVYGKALKLYPGQKKLNTNAVYVWNKWAGIYGDNKDWSQAVDINQRALQHFPDNSTLKNNLKYYKQMLRAR